MGAATVDKHERRHREAHPLPGRERKRPVTAAGLERAQGGGVCRRCKGAISEVLASPQAVWVPR